MPIETTTKPWGSEIPTDPQLIMDLKGDELIKNTL